MADGLSDAIALLEESHGASHAARRQLLLRALVRLREDALLDGPRTTGVIEEVTKSEQPGADRAGEKLERK